MAIQLTRWSPDTCDCVVTYEWDDTVPDTQRIHTLRTIDQRGTEHAHVLSNLLDVLSLESRSANWLVREAQVDGIASGLTWEFDPGRTLRVTFTTNVPAARKAALQERMNALVGIGKVVIT